MRCRRRKLNNRERNDRRKEWAEVVDCDASCPPDENRPLHDAQRGKFACDGTSKHMQGVSYWKIELLVDDFEMEGMRRDAAVLKQRSLCAGAVRSWVGCSHKRRVTT